MKISEIMTKEVKALSPETPVLEALKTLASDKISGLPVVDSEGKIAGSFTEKDILRTILPSYVSKVGRFVYENNPKTVRTKVAKLSEYKVGDLMKKDIVKVLPQTPIYEVAHLMLTQNARRVTVVDEADKVVGIVSRSDVLKHVIK